MHHEDYPFLNLHGCEGTHGSVLLEHVGDLRSIVCMRHEATILQFETNGRGMTDITREVAEWVAETGVVSGQLSLLCRHTSASLTIQENAAHAVRHDLMAWLDRIAPESPDYLHDDEGPDDMPAHLRAMLTGVSLVVPVIGGAMALGTWQGIFLIEHRRAPHRRTVAASLLGV